ncbi:hypothetical protein [Streptomyces sp. NPDC059460]|uniref:hypothetical protein n=1 Tax=Streptomyces sp. NPDC059460 TaxID=3346840 RepID=UPI00367C7796
MWRYEVSPDHDQDHPIAWVTPRPGFKQHLDNTAISWPAHRRQVDAFFRSCSPGQLLTTADYANQGERVRFIQGLKTFNMLNLTEKSSLTTPRRASRESTWDAG